MIFSKKTLIMLTALSICALYGFKTILSEQEWLNWGNKFLMETYDASGEPKLKKYEVTLTPDHFFRLRKTYLQGKQVYYSFKINRFLYLNYNEGTNNTDTLRIGTQSDDIIVQTYNDPKGNIDSMATILIIPVKKTVRTKIDSLLEALLFIKNKNL